MKVSIIIPIYNAESFLPSLLQSILSLDSDPKDYEVIIVDNNSSDKSNSLIEEWKLKNPGINLNVFYYDEKQGSYAARNYGVRKALGEILAFTDGDCILSSDYLKNINKNEDKFKDYVIGGNVDLIMKDKKSLWENYDILNHLKTEKSIKKNKIATANLIVSKQRFFEIGFFSEIESGGDFEWSERASKACKLLYIPDIVVFHPTRKTFKEHLIKYRRFGRGQAQKISSKRKGRAIVYNFLRIFNLSTNWRLTMQLKRRVSVLNLILFNYFFMKLRINMFVAFMRELLRK